MSTSETLTANLVFIYHRSNNKGTISVTLRYNSEENITLGYILLGPRIDAEKVHNAIKSEFLKCSHPLIIPTVLIELTAADLLVELTKIHYGLCEIEKGTGFGDWVQEMPAAEASVPRGLPAPLGQPPRNENPPADDEKPATIQKRRIQYQGWAKELGALSCRFAFHEVAVRCTIMANDTTLREIGAMKGYIPPSKYNFLQPVTFNLKERADFLSSNLAHLEIFGGLAKRLQAQQDVVSSKRPSRTKHFLTLLLV